MGTRTRAYAVIRAARIDSGIVSTRGNRRIRATSVAAPASE
jgi:hypothetical protein